MAPKHRFVAVSLLLLAVQAALLAGQTRLPNRADSAKFAVIASQGDGSAEQREIATRLQTAHHSFPMQVVLLAGNNIVGGQRPQDFLKKFEEPYKPLIAAGVTFHAALGPNDDEMQTSYAPFNMNQKRHYTFSSKDVQFFSIDNTSKDPQLVEWLARELDASEAVWKVAFFYGAPAPLLDRALTEHAVNVIVSAHDGEYAHNAASVPPRFLLQSKGSTRNILLAEAVGNQLFFNVLNTAGDIVDSGVINRSAFPVPRSSFRR